MTSNDMNPQVDLSPAEMGEESPGMQTDRIRQAAILLLCLDESQAAAVLRCLDRESLLKVAQVMSQQNGLKVDMVKQVIDQFFSDFRQQSAVGGASQAFVRRSLELALGASIADKLLENISGGELRGKMVRLQWFYPEWLAEQVMQEHLCIQALFVSYLPADMAGRVLLAMPASHQDALLLEVSRLRHVNHDLLEELDLLVDSYLAMDNAQGCQVEGVQQAVGILNHLGSGQEQILSALRERDADQAEVLEAEMYQFPTLARQNPAVRTAIFDAVAFDDWIIALKGADADMLTAMTDIMPQRMVQSFRQLSRRAGALPRSKVLATQASIMQQVKRMVDEDGLVFQLVAEESVP